MHGALWVAYVVHLLFVQFFIWGDSAGEEQHVRVMNSTKLAGAVSRKQEWAEECKHRRPTIGGVGNGLWRHGIQTKGGSKTLADI